MVTKMEETKLKQNNMLTISIIIPTMNRLDSLKRTISYIAQSTVKPLEIVVVDQSSEYAEITATREFLKCQEINCVYIHNDEPSLTKARNTGMAYIHGDLVIQMDDDVDVKPDTLSSILKIFSNEKIAMLAGVNEGFNSKHRSLIGFLFWKKNWRKRSIGHVVKSMYGRFPEKITEATPTEWAMGFFSVYRVKLINKWNLKWDEYLTSYAYAEDFDFSYSYYKNAKKEDLKCIMSNRVIVKHNVTTEWRIASRKHTYMIINNRHYLRKKHFGNSLLSKIAVCWANCGEYLRRLLKHEAAKDWKDAMTGKPL